MKNSDMLWASIWRFIRVLGGQAVALLITQTANIEIPYLNLGLGAVISMFAKYLRDKFNWDWLPV